MEQRSDEWYKVRLGKVTASRTADFMGVKGIGKMGESYALELAEELLFGQDMDDDFVTYDMQRGIDLEPLAFNKFSEIVAQDFVSVKKAKFIQLDKNTGASPDGIVEEDEPLEIKCPKKSTFFNVVLFDYVDPKHYDQMQFQMMCTCGKQAHYFNYYIRNGKEMWHYIKVPRDEKRIELMRIRIAEILTLRNKFVETLKTKKQW